MINLYDSSKLPVSRWRNGGGETREIISYPPGRADFDWRVSIATIAADGDFSTFPDIDRIITLLSGEVTLWSQGCLLQQLALNQPFCFPGEDPVSARLSGKASTDFNMMTRRRGYQAHAGVATSHFAPANAVSGVVYVIAGQWQHQEALLSAGQGAWWESHAGAFTPFSADARLLWGTFAPLSHDL